MPTKTEPANPDSASPMSLYQALRDVIGKPIAAVHTRTARYAASGKSIEYALADGERILETPHLDSMLIEFKDHAPLLYVHVTYEGELEAAWLSRDSADAALFVSAPAGVYHA